MGAHDGVSAVEAVLDAEQVHGAALAARAAGDLAEELGHDALGRHSLGQGVTVLPVGADPVILRPADGRYTSGHGLLTVVEVAESADLPLLIILGHPQLKPAHQNHLVINVAERLRVDFFGVHPTPPLSL